MEKKRLLLVGNRVPEDWEFRRGVEAETGCPWEVKTSIINEYNGLKKYTRYLTYFTAPLRLFLERNRYETIVSWEQFLGLMIAFYCRLFHVRNCPKLYVMALIYKPKPGLIGKLFAWFVRYAVSSKYVTKIIVYSQSEVPYYANLFGVSEDRFAMELLGVADEPELRKEQRSPQGKRYYLAAGRSNRDYDFLRAAWPRDREEMVVVCDMEKSADSHNIRYEKDCHGADYLRLLAGAYAVVVPLKSERISSGQLVFLQSALMGKPVIATENDTVGDYIEQGVTGLIIPKKAEALREALERLDDPEYYAAVSQAARETYETRFSLFGLGRRVGRLVKESKEAAASCHPIV